MILNQIQNEAHAIQEMFSMLMSLIVQSNLPLLPIMIQLYRQLLVEFFWLGMWSFPGRQLMLLIFHLVHQNGLVNI